MVGKLGNKAVAALGLSVFSNIFILASMDGLNSSVRGIVARRRGEGSTEPKCVPLNAGLLIAFVVGTPLAVLCFLLGSFLFSLISSDSDVTKIGVPFFRILCLSIPAAGMHNAFKRALGWNRSPRVYTLIVFFMASLNALLNYMLIFGHFGAPALGATGAAISTVASLYAGVVINCLIAHLRLRNEGFLTAKPARSVVMRIIELGLPINIAAFFGASGYVIFLKMVSP